MIFLTRLIEKNSDKILKDYPKALKETSPIII
ncbi:hypothetical protein SAMN05421689_1089 [Leptospira interrogans]|nr:Glycerophosphodiester phosphodiesterase family protein [Leptospira interrogans serovar Copenhageni/Icterohaemorrhagiae]SIQ32474.1 hypothetical protein SAMN05421689_1089 [Leptospira interrogans]